MVLAGAAAGATIAWSNAKLSGDGAALARVDTGPLGGTLQSARANTAAGTPVPLVIHGSALLPRAKITPGQKITIHAVIARPGSTAWALGKTRTEQLTVTAPVAKVTSRWLTVKPGSAVRVAFDRPVVTAAATTSAGQSKHLALSGAQSSVSLGSRTAAGTVRVSAAVRSWERLGHATTVSWFPASSKPVVVTDPAAGETLSPSQDVRLTFSTTVADALGRKQPTLSPAGSGSWHEADSHTLVFKPSAAGLGLGTKVSVALPRAVTATTAKGGLGSTTQQLDWTVPPGSTLRLQQLLAEGGYLPVDWTPDDAPVARTRAAESAAAVDAPAGHFSWRYDHTPSELKKQWTPGQISEIVRGAVMMFQSTHGLAVDAAAGSDVWNALIADTIAKKRKTDGYSYVYVHRDTPQLLTLWHNGTIVTTSPGNTGVAAAPTELGTFPVFEHLPVTTMSGTNPDGSHYNDPGIKWVSYFNGGDALHTFNRASFGTPQSLGCVELPEAAAKKVYPYTPIGTLVTIEH